MKVRLLSDGDLHLDGGHELSAHQRDLVDDLGLDLLLDAMAAGDAHVRGVCARLVLDGLEDVEVVARRQGVVADALAHPEAVAAMYAVIGSGLQTARRSSAGLYRESPEPVVRRSVERLGVHLDVLRRLRGQARRLQGGVRSAPWQAFIEQLLTTVDDDTHAGMEALLEELTFPRGMLLSARIGRGASGVDHVLRRPRPQGWLARSVDRSGDSFELPDRDDEAVSALVAWRERALAPVATELSAAADDVEAFLRQLRDELAFLLGAIQLSDRLAGAGMPTCFPEVVTGAPASAVGAAGDGDSVAGAAADGDSVVAAGDGDPVAGAAGDGDPAEPPEPAEPAEPPDPAEPAPLTPPRWRGSGLYDPALAIRLGSEVVPGDLDADGAALVVVTGANQGGKSTLLRAIGSAQVLAQAGLFVPARELRLELRAGVYVHFGREEDRRLRRGRLEEELERMRRIIERIQPGDLLLANESFASTNEAEGSAVAHGVFTALADAGVRVVAVTHLFELAKGLEALEREDTLFLRAQRDEDGTRPFRVEPGSPQPTSFGRDLYLDIFGEDPADA